MEIIRIGTTIKAGITTIKTSTLTRIKVGIKTSSGTITISGITTIGTSSPGEIKVTIRATTATMAINQVSTASSLGAISKDIIITKAISIHKETIPVTTSMEIIGAGTITGITIRVGTIIGTTMAIIVAITMDITMDITTDTAGTETIDPDLGIQATITEETIITTMEETIMVEATWIITMEETTIDMVATLMTGTEEGTAFETDMADTTEHLSLELILRLDTQNT